MKKFIVSITNTITGKKWGQSFTDENKMDKWINQQKKKGNWGLNERTVKLDSIPEELTHLKNFDTYNRVVENGEVIEYMDLIPEYEVNITEESEADYNTRMREKKGPTQKEILDALIENMEGRPEKLTYIKKWRKRLKEEYPEPRVISFPD